MLYITCLALMPCLSMADEILFQNGSKSEVTPSDPVQTTLQSGSVSLNFSDQSIQTIALTEYPIDDIKPSFFVKVAEASLVPPDLIMQDFLKAQYKILAAKSLDDMEDSATANFVKPLKDKVLAGANELMVVSMLQTLRPERIEIKDVRSQKDHGKLAVNGDSPFGKVHGVVDMVQENGSWKIDRETWYSDQKPKIVLEKDLLSTLNIPEPIEEPVRNSSLAILDTPDVRLNRNMLNLIRAHPPIRKREFTFVYYLHKKDELKEHLTGTKEKLPAPVHVLWTGPNQMVPEQKVRLDSPLDFSIADDKDGFMPGAMNLQLPKKRPNGVTISAMFTF